MRIRRKFLQLTKSTFPYGSEKELIKYLPIGYKEDGLGNYYCLIGENPSNMFTCHLDTSCIYKENVVHVQDEKFIRTNGKTILGADDKAGMVVVLNMIEKKIPGLYYFFIGEEVGCIGSGLLADNWEHFPYKDTIKRVISFDRRGTNSVITHQMYGRCCSDNFAEELSFRLNICSDLELEPDDTGVMTDSAKFMELVPECTNISVGYYKEHTFTESQDIQFLIKLCNATCLIDWETLPVDRDPSIIEDEDEDECGYDSKYYGAYSDKDLEWVSQNWTHVKMGNDVKKMYISKTQIDKEKLIIFDWITMRSDYYGVNNIIWTGNKLHVELEMGKIEFVGDRFDLISLIPELKSIPLSQLSDKVGEKVKKKSSLGQNNYIKREFLM